jgi:hypothetical protein
MVQIDGRPAVQVPPAADLRPKPTPQPNRRPMVREGISRAGEAALDTAERAILSAPHGHQEPTLVRRSYAVGCAVADGKLSEGLARAALIDVGRRLPDLDPARPWASAAVTDKINRAFAAGLNGGRHA